MNTPSFEVNRENIAQHDLGHFDLGTLPASRVDQRRASEILESYRDALELGQDRSKGGFQSQRLIDLRSVGMDREIILVGDLHARRDHFHRLLTTNDNFGRAKQGDCIFVFLGDLVHRDPTILEMSKLSRVSESVEDREQILLSEVETSLSMLLDFMRVKTEAPASVYATLGNHDLLHNSVEKSGVPQTDLFRAKLLEAFGGDFLNAYSQLLLEQAIATVGQSFAATHAGPIKRASLEQIQTARITDGPFSQLDPIVRQAIWERMPGAGYQPKDVTSFMQRVGVPNGTFFVGHTPLDDNGWCWRMCDRHYSLCASNDRLGYVSIRGDQINFVELNDGSLRPNSADAAWLQPKQPHRFQYQEPIRLTLGTRSEQYHPEGTAEILVVSRSDLQNRYGVNADEFDAFSKVPFFVVQATPTGIKLQSLPQDVEVRLGRNQNTSFDFSERVSQRHLLVKSLGAEMIEITDRGSRFGSLVHTYW